MGYYSYELERLVDRAQWDDDAKAELEDYIKNHPSEWEDYQEEQEGNQKDDDFEPGSDMHTWATTRFF